MLIKILQNVYRIRLSIYLIGIAAFALSTCHFISAEQNEFWPPDMVPHPNPPWEQPSDPNDEMVEVED
ncbi:hypothetical protein UFOVP80_43 [uncultured Caudovirales phage]|jgi:hypothetical protein|uniref:Uncharacterized protein n=1 Tax=uncultured Caudovirales phage TaxID=2100421 RepID=A0A6J5L064_9CAUD|nr:hypothetical protein UFOVP80_43 [uncultured Caudovirales phage]